MNYENFMSYEDFQEKLGYDKQALGNILSALEGHYTYVQIEKRNVKIVNLKDYVRDWTPHQLTLSCDCLVGLLVHAPSGYMRYRIESDFSGELPIYDNDLNSKVSQYVYAITEASASKWPPTKLCSSFFDSKELILNHLAKIGFNKKYKIIYNGDKVKVEDFLN